MHKSEVVYRVDVIVQVKDRVRTKTGRLGIVRNVTNGNTAHVEWDDGDVFAIRTCHLEVLLRNVDLPHRFSKSLPG